MLWDDEIEGAALPLVLSPCGLLLLCFEASDVVDSWPEALWFVELAVLTVGSSPVLLHCFKHTQEKQIRPALRQAHFAVVPQVE